jgi:hypothetical protein
MPMLRKFWPPLQWIVFVLLVGGATVSAIAALQPPPTPPPPPVVGIEFPVTQVDLGQLQQHTVHTAEFRVVNHGPGPAEVVDVLASCGCTGVKVGRKYIPEGEETTIRVGYSTNQSRGPVTQEVMAILRAADGADKTQPLRIVADVLTDIVATPEQPEFTRGLPAEIPLEFRPGRMKEFEIRSVIATHPCVVVAKDPKFNDDRHYTVSYQPSAGDVASSPRVYLLVDTNSPNEGTISLPVVFRDP